MRRYLGGTLLLLALLAPALAAGDWKLVVRVKGKVQTRLATSNRWKPVFSSRMLKAEKDRVRTLADSVARIRSADESVITLGPDTEVTMEEHSLKQGRVKVRMPSRRGSIRVEIGKFFRGERRYQVETPNSVLAARGTEFIVLYRPTVSTAGPIAALPDRVPWVAQVTGGRTIVDVLSGKVSHGKVTVRSGERFTNDGASYTLGPTPDGYPEVPPVLVPQVGGSSTLQKSTSTLTNVDNSPVSGTLVDLNGAVYQNPFLPFLEGAQTTTIQVDLNITN